MLIEIWIIGYFFIAPIIIGGKLKVFLVLGALKGDRGGKTIRGRGRERKKKFYEERFFKK